MPKSSYDPIKQRISNRKSYLKHRKKRLKKAMEYHWKNREKIIKKHREYLNKRYWDDPEVRNKHILYMKEHYRKNRAKYLIASKKRSKTFKHKVRMKVHIALNSGKLIRPDKCDNCNKKGIPQAHHHKGYEYPLDVIWLCRRCHGIAHRK